MTPAVKAGTPEIEKDFIKTKVEGITFYIRKDMADQKFEIQWVGFWIFGQFVVREL